jgi:uncharacterized damage-inducible protein DinB
MMKAYLEQLYDYNVWANGLVLKYAQKLPEEQYTQETTHSFGSIRDTLVHILFVEWLWRERIQGNPMDVDEAMESMKPENFPTMDDLYHRWFDEELAMRNFLGDLSEEGYLETFGYVNIAGRYLEDTKADGLTQLVLHGMQHRAEVAAVLTEFGFSPGNLDYYLYLHAE